MSTSKDHTLPAYVHSFRTFSIIMSAAMDFLGYSYKAIKHRQTYYANLSHDRECYAVGSKGEGITLLLESDTDRLYVGSECLCTDDISDVVYWRPLLLLAEMDDLHPGYTKLKVPFPNDLTRLPYRVFEKSSIKTKKGAVYLSSRRYNILRSNILRSKQKNNGDYTILAGVSLCSYYPSGSYDNVMAIRYQSKTLLHEWITRPRFHGWPSEDYLREVAKLDWHLVPVGPTQTDGNCHKWRICFTLGELYLVKTFNIAQLHLLILLKYIMSKSLKPICSAFSSYTAKNLVFWMAEILAPENFKSDNICSLMMMSIQVLRKAAENERLNNYMIPSRNLLKEKMSRQEKNKIIPILDRFIEAGPAFIMKNPEFSELQDAMQKVNDNPEFAQQESKRKIRITNALCDLPVFISQQSEFEQQTQLYETGNGPDNFLLRVVWINERISEYAKKRGLNPSDLATPMKGLF